ncbi:MAG: Cell division protein FtsX [Patescibacteria group bacterium]|nr:Cell division protein FtsX [Patescibacteria group bacterium]
MLTNLKRVIRSGSLNFWRNGAVALASILVLTVTLLVIGSLYLGNTFLRSTLEDIRDRVDISVAFKTDAEESAVLSLKKDLEQLPEVKTVTYSSREQELADFRKRHEDNALLIQSLEEVGNPFGARLSVLAIDPAQYDSISRFLSNYNDNAGASGIIDQISFKKDIIAKLLAIISTSQTIGLAASALLVLMSILVTVNTISLTIYIAREEISVMRLVGADNSYIRGPFIVEGVIAGGIAAFVSIILLYPSVLWVRSMTAGVYGGIDLVSFYISHFGILFLILLSSGIILGTVSSFLAIGRYLKV